MTQKTEVKIQTELSRDLGLVSVLAIGIGTMIAAGIFTLSGLAIRNVGSAAIVSFWLAAVVSTFTALTYCEFVSIYPESGEGYLYARKTFPGIFAYMVGWCLFLGYTSSCAFYLASFSSYFREFVLATPFKALAGIMALLGLVLLNIKGTKESGNFQIVVTAVKVLLLIWFVCGGLRHIDTHELIAKFDTDILRIGSTATMVFITFFGFSAIAASAGEVKNPVTNIPRAIFISMIGVTVLYTLVVIAILAAGLTEYTESAMGNAARKFLGPVGGMVIVGGALFSMISASNASIMAGSRVSLTMSRMGQMPYRLGLINPRTKTPVLSLAAVGGAILVFVLSMPLEALAHFADTVLLLALILVNAALIVHRRKFPNIERPFRVPMVPLLPALGIAANGYLLAQILHHPLPVELACGCIMAGMAVFFVWKGTSTEDAELPGTPSRVAMGRYAAGKSDFRVLVPIANPSNVGQLIGMAAAIASKKNGEIIALRTVIIPEQLPPTRENDYVEREREILELAHREALKHGVAVTSLVRVGHNVARAILETSREWECNLIILGWKGYTSTGQKILGEISDAVVKHARTDIMLAKLIGNDLPRRLLLPTARGKHAEFAREYVATLAGIHGDKGAVTLCSVEHPDSPQEKKDVVENHLEQSRRQMQNLGVANVDKKIIHSASVTEGIIQETSGHDAIVVGATERSVYPQILFGSIPEIIAKKSDRTVIVVKHYSPIKELIGRVIGDSSETDSDSL